MAYTASLHLGDSYCLLHNNRQLPEPHIDPNGKYEIWVQRDVNDILKEEFKQSIEEYNKKQKRKDRKIDFRVFVKENKKTCVYEIIVMLGNHDHKPTEEIAYKILKEYFEDFAKRNPNLILVNVVYHADELGTLVKGQDNSGGVHLHIDYIPVAQNYVNGLSKRISETKAYNEAGFFTGADSKRGYAYTRTKFIDNEREIFHEICKKHGLEIAPPKASKEKHLEMKVFKLERKYENLEKAISEKQAEYAKLESSINDSYRSYERVEKKVEKNLNVMENDAITLTKDEYKRLTRGGAMYTEEKTKVKQKDKEIEELERTISDLKTQLVKTEKELEKAEHTKDAMENFMFDQTLADGQNALHLFRKLMKKLEKKKNKTKSSDDLEH